MSGRQNLFKRLKDSLTYKPPATSQFILPKAGDEMSERTDKRIEIYGDEQIPVDYLEKNIVSEKRKKGFTIKKPIKLGQDKKHDDNFDEKRRAKKETLPDILTPESRIVGDIYLNLAFMEKEMNIPVNQDVIIRRFKIGRRIDAFLVFLDGMVDRKIVNEFILKPLMVPDTMMEDVEQTSRIGYINENIIASDKTYLVHTYKDVFTEILSGYTVLFVDGCGQGLSIGGYGFQTRAIDRPQTENVIQGSQEGFTENVNINVTMLRRIIKNKDLLTEILTVGETNHNRVAILYLKGIANPAVINEVKRRIQSIRTDYIFGHGAIEQFIEDRPFMLVPQLLSSERPDRVASHIMEGKVAIISDGSPFALVAPTTFFSLLHSPEDSYSRWQFASFMRIIRFLGFLFATLLPGFYLALVTFHQQTIPTDLLFSIARSREAVPFPTIVEVILMEFAFELIREASIRVPGAIGTTLGIIGALILGQAAVAAKIVSPILIIIVAVTGMGSYVIPNYELGFSVRILRFLFIVLAGTLGILGITLGMIMVSSFAVSIKSFGMPFFAMPWTGTYKERDSILRYPIWQQEERTDNLQTLDKKRQPDVSRGWVKGKPPEGNRE